MLDHLLRDLQVLYRADFLIGRIWANVLARRLLLFSFAALIAVFGLGMADVAAFYALQASVAPVWAATIIAAADFVVSAIVLLVGSKSRPGPELDLAFDVRKMAVEAIQTDAGDLKLTLETMGQNIRGVKEAIAGAMQNPLDIAAQKLLVPAVLSIVKGLRSKKQPG